MSYHLILVLVLSPRIKISFPLLSICTDDLISSPRIMTFFPKNPSVNKNSEQQSNPIPSSTFVFIWMSVIN